MVTNKNRQSVVRHVVALLGLTFCFLLSSTLALAGHHDEDDSREHKKEMSLPCLSYLKLTARQKEEIYGLNRIFQKEIERLRSEEFKLRTELKLLWMQSHPDPRKIMAKERSVHDLKWQMKEKSVDYRLRFRSLLTAEQLAEYLKEGSQHHHKHQHHED